MILAMFTQTVYVVHMRKTTYASNFSAFVFLAIFDSKCSELCLLLALTAGGNTRKSKSSSEKIPKYGEITFLSRIDHYAYILNFTST